MNRDVKKKRVQSFVRLMCEDSIYSESETGNRSVSSSDTRTLRPPFIISSFITATAETQSSTGTCSCMNVIGRRCVLLDDVTLCVAAEVEQRLTVLLELSSRAL